MNARLGSSFGAAAGAYAEHRPDYAPAAVGWAVETAPGSRVLDLGAGTGKLTAGLLAVGARVVAVEPDPAMLAELRRALPSVPAWAGSAESIPLDDAAVDAVLAGNALHWFDLGAAGPELLRVLGAGGVLAGLWNLLDDRVDWVAGLAEVAGEAAVGPRDTPDRWREQVLALPLSPAGFDDVELGLFEHRQRRTADSLVDTLATRAGMLVLPPDDRAAARRRIRTYLAGRDETARGEFDLPMVTGVLRARRRG